MLKSCFLTLQEIVVVEKTQVFHYCEPARGREKKRESVCVDPIMTAEPNQPRLRGIWVRKADTAQVWGWSSHKPQRQHISWTQNCSPNPAVPALSTKGTTGGSVLHVLLCMASTHSAKGIAATQHPYGCCWSFLVSRDLHLKSCSRLSSHCFLLLFLRMTCCTTLVCHLLVPPDTHWFLH